MNDDERREAKARLAALIREYDLTRCPVCGEYRNAEHNILCICDGTRCRVCGRVKSHRVFSRYVDEDDRKLWWCSHITGWKVCPYCHPEHYEGPPPRMTDEEQHAWASIEAGQGDGDGETPPYEIIAPSDWAGPLVAHIPHASTRIPPDARRQILLNDADLHREIVRLTDWHTDALFSWMTSVDATVFLATLSRLVFDPERFEDDALEPTASVGQGVVYTKTTEGTPLASITADERARRIREFYRPYHEALSTLVAARLDVSDCCTIIDCHSFATIPLPSETDQSPSRPDICIGTDEFHTPSGLADRLEESLSRHGFRVGMDSPFSGALVPIEYYRVDRRVKSVLIEVRRGLYCDEQTGERNSDFDEVREKLRRAVTWAIRTS
jgi:N-formylglutamate amidohydrolase